MSLFRRRYGSGPVHLLAHLIVLPLAFWAILKVADFRNFKDVAVWFVAGLLLHDMVVLPLYSGLDRLAQRARVRGVPAVNFLRFPAVISGLTFIAFSGVITGKSDGAFAFVSGIELEGYLGRYLMLVAALFALSALLFVVRVGKGNGLPAAGPGQDDALRGW